MDHSERPLTSRPPNLDALQDALNTQLPTRPTPAHLPPAFHSSSVPPVFFDSLTRATLPVSSLVSTNHTPDLEYHHPRPIVSTYHRTSLDELRSLHDRKDHPPPPPLTSNILSTNWLWFLPENSPSSSPSPSGPNPQREQRTYRAPKNPLVFCHGLLGFDSVTIGPAIAPLHVQHWRGLKEALEAVGCEVLITRVPATSSPADRARVLSESIAEKYAGRSVHLIGHSMGGVDCRYLTTHLPRPFRVLSVTTVSTPHRGSHVADAVLSALGPDHLPTFVNLLGWLPQGGGDGAAFRALTRKAMKEFNESTPDVPGVKYFSWGAVYEPGLIDTWRWSHSVLLETEGPNDGLVSVASARWGTYLGTLSNVSHLDLIGWVNEARYRWAAWTGREIDFRVGTFYLGVADFLRGVEEEGALGEGAEAESNADAHGGTAQRSESKVQADAKESLKKGGEVRDESPQQIEETK